MTHTTKLARWATILTRATTATMVIMPLAVIYGAATTLDGAGFAGAFALVIGLVSPAILLWTLNEMRQLFGAFALGAVFTETSATLIRRIGQGFLALAVAPFVLQPLQLLLLSLNSPPGQRSISIAIESDMIFFALAGGLIIVIGWAMRDATLIAEENRTFV